MTSPISPASDRSEMAMAPGPAAFAAEALVNEPRETDLPKAGPGYVWSLIIATFGIFVAFIAPLGISLAVRLQQLAPGNEEYLGYILGIGSLFAMFSAPVIGILSDSTRSRFGRRRPWLVAGAVLGLISLVVMAWSPSVFMLGVGWVLAQIGWGGAMTVLTVTQADRLSETQRGKVAGTVGFVMMVSPVVGSGLAASFVGDAYLMFLVPGIFGAIGVLLFVALVRGDDSRALELPKTTLRGVLGNYFYSPRLHPDFSWNWLARFLFNVGVTFSTTFTIFFFANRMGVPVDQAASIMVVLGLGGVIASGLGALLGGILSDKMRRRRAFVLASGILFTAGAVIMALGTDVPVLMTGSIITSLGLGIFSAVDQAILLDVLPDREKDAGRFMGINTFSTTVPQAVAPLIAPAILLIGATAGEKNYTLLFLVASAFTLAGGALVLAKVKGSR